MTEYVPHVKTNDIEDRHIAPHFEINDIEDRHSVPQDSANLPVVPSHGLTADHPDCEPPPECMPVSPAVSITSLINFTALNEERIRLRKSYQCIADAVKLSKATVSRFFAGQTPNPSLYNTILIFGFLGLSLDEAVGFTKPAPPAPPVETNHELLRKMEHLEYVVTVKDKHIADLQSQLADAVALRDKYKKHFMDETERQRAHYESEIDKIRIRADKQFRSMFSLVVVVLLVLIFYVLADLCLADRGLFQYNGLI